MESLFVAGLVALLSCFGVAEAETTPPWLSADSVLRETQADVNRSGVKAVASHVDAIEKALQEGAVCFPRYDTGTGDIVVLANGVLDTMMALGSASAAQKDGKLRNATVNAIANPYPMLALYLGSYYNETDRFDDAARVLAKGLSLSASPNFGESVPYLTSEHALALARGQHLTEALAAYDDGLKLPAIDDKNKARMQRGRGYVLTEMNRLDEAEAAYKESLRLEPGNQVALGELDYIVKLRNGGEKAPSGITLSNPPAKN